VAMIAQTRPIHGCGFIESEVNVVMLREDAASSKIILLGRLTNAQGGPEGGSPRLAMTFDRSRCSRHPKIASDTLR
jgi:hypothetical protein